MVIARIADEIKKKRVFAITAHVSPEGDALGSELALAIALRQLGKEASVINFDPVPRQLRFLPHDKVIKDKKEIEGSFDALFVLDCGDIERTNLFKDAPPSVPLVINIDHHLTNKKFGHINWVEESAAATGELIYYLIERLGLRITPDIAICLYTTLLTETGNFNYSNTSSKVLRIAADLVEAGADPWKIAVSLGENSPERLRLLGELLINIEKSRDGKIAWFTITNELFERTKTSAEDTENLVNYPRSLLGVEVALLFREVSPDSFKISLRSNGVVNVAEIATKFAGGGHKYAAGCLVKGRLDAVKDLVIGAVESVTSSGICKD